MSRPGSPTSISRSRAFSHAELRELLVERFGVDPAEVTPARLGYQLAKLRAKGLLRRVAHRNGYTLTDPGYRVVLYWTKLHQRLLSPALDTLDPRLQATLVASPHTVDRALADLNTAFDCVAALVGLELAA